jgi:phosphatidylserine synthase
MSEENVYKTEEKRKLEASSLPAWLVIGIGVVLLAANLFQVHLIDWLWPGFVIAPGLMLMWPAFNSTAERQSKASFLAVPGAIVVTIGLLLFVMNLTNHFEAWAYSWTLLLVAAAAGLMYVRRFDVDHGRSQSTHKFIRTMITLFGVLAAFFEIVVFENFTPWLALALIGYGVYMLVRRRGEVAK